MKPSQQIAEEMISQSAMKLAGDKRTPYYEAILDCIPLTQLIEVARTAKESQGFAALINDEDIGLEKALTALKQTGKADWL